MCELKKAKCHRRGLFIRVIQAVSIVMRQYDVQTKPLPAHFPAPDFSFTIRWNTSLKNWNFSLPQNNLKFPENNEETEILLFGTVSLHHLCFNTVPGFFFFGSVQIVGFSYLLRLPGLRDCTGPHSSLPALGTAEGVLHTHTHNIHTSRFKGLKDWLVWG